MKLKFLSLFIAIDTILWFLPKQVGAISFSEEPGTVVLECQATARTLFTSTIDERIESLVLLLAIAFLLGILTVVVVNATRRKRLSRGLAVVVGLFLIAIPFASNAVVAQICTENVWIPEELEKVVMAVVGYGVGILVGLLDARFMNKMSRMTQSTEQKS